MTLAEVFLAGAGQKGRAVPHDALETALKELHENSRRAWPSIEVSGEAYVHHLAERVDDQGDVLAALAAVHASDLYLACACAAGDRTALEELDRRLLSPLVAYLTRSDALVGFGDDIKQMVRERLLVGGEGAPRIAAYNGDGPLRSWLRVAAVRVAINFRRSLDPQATPSQIAAGASALATPPDAETRYLKALYGDEFRGALERTLTQLSVREGNLLRLHFLEGMKSDSIAALYRVSRRTVHRWLTETRDKILDETHGRLRRRLRLSTSQFDTLIGLFRTELAAGLGKLPKKARERGSKTKD